MVAFLEVTRRELSAKIVELERQLSSGREQLWEVEGAVANLKSANEELEAHAFYLIA